MSLGNSTGPAKQHENAVVQGIPLVACHRGSCKFLGMGVKHNRVGSHPHDTSSDCKAGVEALPVARVDN